MIRSKHGNYGIDNNPDGTWAVLVIDSGKVHYFDTKPEALKAIHTGKLVPDLGDLHMRGGDDVLSDEETREIDEESDELK